MKNATKLKAIRLPEVYVLNFLGCGITRTIWGDHQRYKDTYFSTFPGKYFTGDGFCMTKLDIIELRVV
jgi:acyl-coenzyme A synthetase/AMP-(fatty) acid ligase